MAPFSSRPESPQHSPRRDSSSDLESVRSSAELDRGQSHKLNSSFGTFEVNHGEQLPQQTSQRAIWQRFSKPFRRAPIFAVSPPWSQARKPRWIAKVLMVSMLTILAIFGLTQLFLLTFGVFVLNPSDHISRTFGKYSHNGVIHTLPPNLTRGTIPVHCHSHNDYDRKFPLLEALYYGCTSVEADVWLFEDELFVGHTTKSLTRDRTFRNMYVDPITRLLDRQNNVTSPSTRLNGVFVQEPSEPLILLVDLKTDGYLTLPAVELQLAELRSSNYLTYFNGSAVIPGPVTVVATGNAPFDLLTANETYRDIFFDAPVVEIWHGQQHPDDSSDSRQGSGQGTIGTGNVTGAAFTPLNSYYASVAFPKALGYNLWPLALRWPVLTKRKHQILREQIAAVQAQGLKVRYWSTPTWPRGLRDYIWRVLWEDGADFINSDDLKAVTYGAYKHERTKTWFSLWWGS